MKRIGIFVFFFFPKHSFSVRRLQVFWFLSLSSSNRSTPIHWKLGFPILEFGFRDLGSWYWWDHTRGLLLEALLVRVCDLADLKRFEGDDFTLQFKMFWRMAGLSTASAVETILDKEKFTLEELLDEDEIIQECKALNSRLINFFRERTRVEQLIRYIVEEAAEDDEKRRTFKFPFIACEIFTCEVDIILKTLVEDEELMNLLFSFLEHGRPPSALLAGYFSKVVICLLLRKTVPLMNYIRAHQDIMKKLVDLIGITSIMEVLIRLIGADEHLYSNYMDSMQWLEETDVLEMIVDKFSSSDCPEVHANAAETLCAITRYAPPGLAAKISSPSFITRLFRHTLEDSRPKSVLVNSLSVCISLLDPKRPTMGAYHMFNRQLTHGSVRTANPETVEGMLENLGDLLKLLDVSSEESVLLTTYGKLQPPLGQHRLKIIEFISVLVSVSSEAAENELIRLSAGKRILDLFFEYPYNNFLHHHVEHIIVSCLESKNAPLVEHLLHDCNFVGKMLEADKNFTLAADPNKPTVPAEGRSPPRIGNIGHVTRISNKLVQLANNNSDIQAYLQENSEWVDWHTNVLLKRNQVENVYQWACGRPTALQDRTRDSDDDDYQDRDYDVAALANNLSQAFRYGIYSNDDTNEAHGSLERDDEDVYFDDESAEVVISSLRLGDDQESGSLFTNSNWFAFENDRIVNERSTDSLASPSPNTDEGTGAITGGGEDEVVVDEDDDLADTATSQVPESKPTLDDSALDNLSEDLIKKEAGEGDKPPEWVTWKDSSDSMEPSDATSESIEPFDATSESNEPSKATSDSTVPFEATSESIEPSKATSYSIGLFDATSESIEPSKATSDSVEPSNPTTDPLESPVADRCPLLPNGELEVESEPQADAADINKTDNSNETSASSLSDHESADSGKSDALGLLESADSGKSDALGLPELANSGKSDSSRNPSQPQESGFAISSFDAHNVEKHVGTED